MKKPTQEEIANKLGLSRATVSRVLRNISGPKSSTAARIISLAREMGYRLPATEASAARKGSARQETLVLGLFLCMPDTPPRSSQVPMRVLHGATDAARVRGAFLHVEHMLTSEAEKILSRQDLPEALRKKKLAGVVIEGLIPPRVAALIAERKPCVQMMLHDRDAKVDVVGQDDRTAVENLVSQLRQAGHKKIGYYCKHPVAAYAYARFAGYVEALAREGTPYDPAFTVNLWEREEALPKIQALIHSGVRAWICEHDGLGYELAEQLRRAGLRVPEDVSVCGFDHLDTSPGMKPLTTIEWPFEDMAAAAVEMLFRRINDPTCALSQSLFGGRLVKGETVGSLL
jgi:LacI family transcriptional regulator